MNRSIDIRLIKFYLWLSLAFLLLWLVHDLANYPETFGERVFNNIWRSAYLVVLNFIFFEYTVPFVLRKRKYIISNILLAIVVLMVHLMLWSYGLYAWRLLGIGFYIFTPLVSFECTQQNLETQMGYSASSVFFFGVIRHIYRYLKLKQATQQLRIEKQQAELNYLRSQTNPHFLFNTLNNIYSLARDKSDLAPESILRLSKILRFMLYETGGDNIPIETELKIIAYYIALEKLRYDNSLRVDLHYEIPDKTIPIPPLLLIPLVENAFK